MQVGHRATRTAFYMSFKKWGLGLSGSTGLRDAYQHLFSTLINGSPIGFFNSTRGLRQGDPLSPYLFVIGMEVFSILVDKAASRGFLSGFKIVNRDGEELQINHLLFVDDTLVFCSDSRDQLAYLSWILLWFEAIFGLKINLDKSSILSIGDVVNLDVLASEMGCIGVLPSTYLGLPLGTRRNSP